MSAVTVQFHINKWDDSEVFADDFRACEAVYGRVPNEVDIERAYKRYLDKVVEK